MTVYYDPTCPQTQADPYPVFSRLRKDDPVHWCEPLQAWLVTRYDDVVAMLRDEVFSAERLTPFFARLPGAERARLSAVMRYLSAWMVFRDPPQHTRLRALAARAFLPGRIRYLESRIEALLDDLLSRTDLARFELVETIAGPLPALVIMDMLGVPAADMPAIKQWSDDLALFVGSAQATAGKYERAEAGARALAAYFKPLLDERRRKPREDLLSEMLAAAKTDSHSKASGSTDDEVVASAVLLLFAGHETTTHLIANAVYHMVIQEQPWRELAADVTRAKHAVEEALRFESPVMSLPRVVSAPFEFHGRQLQAGQRVFAMVNSANRDENIFDVPDRFDLSRRHSRHIGFGYGLHTCLGAPLARLEGTVALRVLAGRLPHLEYGGGAPQWLDSMVFRGMQRLPLRAG